MENATDPLFADAPPKPTWRQRFVTWAQQSVGQRYGWAGFLLLVMWIPVCLLLPFRAIIDNAFLLESYVQLLVLTAVNTMALVFSVTILRILNERYGPSGICGCVTWLIGNGNSKWSWRQGTLVFACAIVSPGVLAWLYPSEYAGEGIWHVVWSVVAIVAGTMAAYAFLLLLGRTKAFAIGSDAGTENYFPFEAVDRAGIAAPVVRWIEGWFAKIGFEEIDIQLGIYTFLLAVIHYAVTYVFPDESMRFSSAPTVAILLMWVGIMVLSGAAYWLDKVRCPVLIAFALVIAGTRITPFLSQDATIATVADNSTSQLAAVMAQVSNAERDALLANGDRAAAVLKASASLEETAWNAIVTRMAKLQQHDAETGKTLVIVTCPGGGIHAAAWSTCVLESISHKYPRFRDSLGVISCVSGGSVGTLFYVSTAYADVLEEPATNRIRTSAFELATTSSLEPIAYGMMTDDMYGTFLPRLSVSDRGQRLEDSLEGRLADPVQNQTMGSWGDQAIDGLIPIVVFNSTDAVTGRRVLFDTIPTPIRKSNIGLTSRPINYRELVNHDLPGSRDVKPVSAARTSASFPYVSPFVRPKEASSFGQYVALGDGGYVDNEGIVTAVDWVGFLLRRWANTNSKERPFQRILLLRISPSVNSDALDVPSSPWLVRAFRWLTGPIETLASVRSTSQSERGNLETDLASLYLTTTGKPISAVTTNSPDETAGYAYTKELQELVTQAPIINPVRDQAARQRFLRKQPQSQQQKQLPAKAAPEFAAVRQTMRSTFGPDDNSPPVIVMEIPFDTGRDDLTIPLNWKLSREQKTWYENAWKKNLENTQLTELLERLFGE